LDSSQLRTLQKFLPAEDEAVALKKYTNRANAEEIQQLSDCERFMIAMMNVTNVQSKFDCMIFQLQFHDHLQDLLNDIILVERACDSVRHSAKLKKLLASVLSLGNEINSNEEGDNMVEAFKLETLLKLSEVSIRDKMCFSIIVLLLLDASSLPTSLT